MLLTRLKSTSYAVSGFAFLAVLLGAGSSPAAPPDHAHADLERRFETTVRPVLQEYCVACHGKQKPQAELDLASFTNLDSVIHEFARWELLSAKVAANQMPPAAIARRPTTAQNQALIAFVKSVRGYEAARDAGDPGPVLAHRLSNAEYDYTIRDLTGQDLRPTHDFPVDPANQEGFDNTGESLTLSSALIKKYMQAARDISDHLVLTSTGIEFASHPVIVETDRDKFCILRIVDFYKQQPTDLAAYFDAAWRYRYREELGQPGATLESTAEEAKVSPHYLEIVWKTLSGEGARVGPIAKLQSLWNALPTPASKPGDRVKTQCEGIRDWAAELRKKLAWKFPNLRVPHGFSDGGQVFVLWKDREYASHRRMLDPDGLQIGGTPGTHVVRTNGENRRARTVTDPIDPDLFVPQDMAARAPYLASFNQFCNVIPDAFYISERGRMFVDDPGDKGRLLTAGLHNSMGYFRDDTPLMELILDDAGRNKLNHMWLDFDQVAHLPERMHREFFHYERAESGILMSPEFNSFHAEDKDIVSNEKVKALGDLYLAKAKRNSDSNGAEDDALQAIVYHFKWVAEHIRATEQGRLAAEPLHLAGLIDFAQRAYRRPLTGAERADILAFYRSLRQKEGLDHEEAMRDSIAAILMSPKFMFRMDGAPASQGGVRTASDTTRSDAQSVLPLTDYDLASRLSYFLWSSMPDRELLSHAAAGDLHRPDVLLAQAHRMIKDSRVQALAVEFGGNWLDFRRFEEHNAVDRNRFPAFTDSLRESMFEEPVHLLTDEFQNNRPVLDLLYGNYTFVNGPLAKHYGMTGVDARQSAWVRVDDADKYGRGGLLPMSVFLTQNSPGLRTSPVKRGYWVVRKVLGEYIPPPPPTVPLLPNDESKMGELTLRQALVQHRSNPACAGCHARFDSYGLVFEGYGPVGERRTKDLGGKTIDSTAPFPGGVECAGVDGLKEFIRSHRENDFLDTYTRKLLSYALGRSLQPSDDLTLAEMRKRMSATGDRFDAMVDTIVESRQFRYRRAAVAKG